MVDGSVRFRKARVDAGLSGVGIGDGSGDVGGVLRARSGGGAGGVGAGVRWEGSWVLVPFRGGRLLGRAWGSRDERWSLIVLSLSLFVFVECAGGGGVQVWLGW